MFVACLCFFLALSTCVEAADTLRICTYNLLWYSGDGADLDRDDHYKTVLDAIDPDILIALEIESRTGAEKILSDVLAATEWSSCTLATNYGKTAGKLDVVLYFRTGEFTLTSQDTIATNLRHIAWYELNRIDSPGLPPIYIAGAHLKASDGRANRTRRADEVDELLSFIDNEEFIGSHMFFGGDFNFYGDHEQAYQNLLDDDRFIDPLDSPGKWHDHDEFAEIHTQNTRDYSGGLDDRFDFILTSPNWSDGIGWEYVDGSYTAFGNDGAHFDTSVNAGTNHAVSDEIADALFAASDHLPVYLDFTFVDSVTASEEETFFATPNGCCYHLPTCSSIQHSSDLIEYTSAEDAIADGYRACKRCKP